MTEALFFELDFSALLGKGAGRTAAREKEVSGAVALDRVARTSHLASAHTDQTTATETMCHAVCDVVSSEAYSRCWALTHDGFITDNTLHGVLADGTLFTSLVTLHRKMGMFHLTEFSSAWYLARLRPYETHGKNQETTPMR